MQDLVLRPPQCGAVIEIVRQGGDLRLGGMHPALGLGLGHPEMMSHHEHYQISLTLPLPPITRCHIGCTPDKVTSFYA